MPSNVSGSAPNLVSSILPTLTSFLSHIFSLSSCSFASLPFLSASLRALFFPFAPSISFWASRSLHFASSLPPFPVFPASPISLRIPDFTTLTQRPIDLLRFLDESIDLLADTQRMNTERVRVQSKGERRASSTDGRRVTSDDHLPYHGPGRPIQARQPPARRSQALRLVLISCESCRAVVTG